MNRLRAGFAPMIRIITSCILMLVLTSCPGDPNEAAKRLFAEARHLTEIADAQDPEERLRTLLVVENRLQTIVDRYQAADLGRQLGSGQSVGKLSLKSITDSIAEAQEQQWVICLGEPKHGCVLDQALRVAPSTENWRWTEGAMLALFVWMDRERCGLGSGPSNANDGPSGLHFLVKACAKGGSINTAMLGLAHIRNEGARGYAIRTIVNEQQKASWSAQLMVAAVGGAHELATLGVAQAKAGLTKEAVATLDEALNIAQSEKEEWIRTHAIGAITIARAKAGMISESLQVAQSIEDESIRASALAAISEAQAKAGMITEALRVAQSIKDESGRSWALAAISIMQTQALRIAEALRTVQFIEDEGARASLLRGIVEEQAKKGRTKEAVTTFGHAIQIVQSIKNEPARASALAAIIEAQAMAGVTHDTVSTLDLAVEVAQSIKEEEGRNFLLRAIVEAQVKGGMITGALKAALSIENRSNRAFVLGVIAASLPE